MIHVDVVGPHGGEATPVLDRHSVDTSPIHTPDAVRRIRESSLREGVRIPVDVHILNMQPSAASIASYVDAGADYVTVHWEAFPDKEALHQTLVSISQMGAIAGMAIRPDSDLADILGFITANHEVIGLVSQAGVYPCLGGQRMVPGVVARVDALNDTRTGHQLPYQIMVDGGVEAGTPVRLCASAGADILVVGSAFFGAGFRDLETLEAAAVCLKDVSPIEMPSVYGVIARCIAEKQARVQRPVWVLVEAYHGGGKTYTAERLREKLVARGIDVVTVGLDISWTDRRDRSQWVREAYAARGAGRAHSYFDALGQSPPMHWRKPHAGRAVRVLEAAVRAAARTGKPHRAVVEECYQFNDIGDADGQFICTVTPRTVLLVEGVYASMLDRSDWDTRIYIASDQESAKMRAMGRDEVKVHRPRHETRMLYEDVYEPSYREYLSAYRPIEQADIVLDATQADAVRMPRPPRITKAVPHAIVLECIDAECRSQMLPTRMVSCRRCGGELRNTIIGDVDFLGIIDGARENMWRYHPLMPVNPTFIVGDEAGRTPAVYLPKVSKELGVHLWLKLEITNPTGTFKDREGAYVIAVSRQEGQRDVVMQSTGNTAIAVTYYAGLAGIPSWVFVPASNVDKLLMPPRSPMNRIIAVAGQPIDVKRFAEDFAQRYSFPKISPFHERCEANATQAYEIAEALLTRTLPAQELLGGGFDCYVQTIAAGMGPLGFYVGMRRIQDWTHGVLKIPRILAVEITEFAPIQAAWEEGLERVGAEVATPRFPSHDLFAPTLWTTNIARYYPHIREMLLATNGLLTAVSPEQVRSTTRQFGIQEELADHGYHLAESETCSFVGFAGLAEKVRSGEVERGSRVLLMLTGKGVHDTHVVEQPDFVVDVRRHRPRDVMAAVG